MLHLNKAKYNPMEQMGGDVGGHVTQLLETSRTPSETPPAKRASGRKLPGDAAGSSKDAEGEGWAAGDRPEHPGSPTLSLQARAPAAVSQLPTGGQQPLHFQSGTWKCSGFSELQKGGEGRKKLVLGKGGKCQESFRALVSPKTMNVFKPSCKEPAGPK